MTGCPKVGGVSAAAEGDLGAGPVWAKLNKASRRPNEQRPNARKMRGLKTPDSEARFLFITPSYVSLDRLESYYPKAPPTANSFYDKEKTSCRASFSSLAEQQHLTGGKTDQS